MPLTDSARAFLEQHADLADRDAMLLRRAVETLSNNTVSGEGKPWSPYRGIVPSHGTYDGVWNWDAAFHALAVCRWDPELAREQALIFFDHQQPNGGFVDVLFSNGEIVSDFGKPPVWPWALQLMHERATGSLFLEKAWNAFLSNLAHWIEHRQHNGLFHYDTATREGDWLTQVKYESGWDNSVRWDDGIVDVLPVDLNSYMVLFYDAMGFIGEKMGFHRSGWEAHRDHLRALIEERLWNEEAGAYMDFNFFKGSFTGVLSPASFVPLFAGVATDGRAARMAELAQNPKLFFPGMPTVAYSDPNYSRDMWRGPCWLNTAYFAIKGLQRYGHVETAEIIRETILDWCATDEHLREYYDAKTGEGLAAVDFGWTAAFVIELILDWD